MSVQYRPNRPARPYQAVWWEGTRSFSRSFARKQDAEQLDRTIKWEKYEGRFVRGQLGHNSFKEAAEDFLRLYSRRYCKPTSHNSNVQRAKNLVRWFGHFRLKDISARSWAEYQDWRLEAISHCSRQKIKHATLNRDLALMKSILYKAVEWDQLLQNPLRKIKLLKEDDAPAVFFTTDELDQLIAAADPMIARMIIVAAYTGMRLGKITGLLWKHIDYANNYITEENPKNSRGRRIRMHPRVAGALRSQPRYLFSEIVFPSLNLTPISEMATYFKRAMKKAGINKKATFHTLKHTFASHLAMNGVPLITIKELLGHSSLNMVQRYAHLSPQHLEGAIDSLYTGS